VRPDAQDARLAQIVSDLRGLCALGDQAEVAGLLLVPPSRAEVRLGGETAEDPVLEV
jgi:hypothetical protein